MIKHYRVQATTSNLDYLLFLEKFEQSRLVYIFQFTCFRAFLQLIAESCQGARSPYEQFLAFCQRQTVLMTCGEFCYVVYELI